MKIQTNKYNLEIDASPAQEHMVNAVVEKLLRSDPAHLNTKKKKKKENHIQKIDANQIAYKGLLLVKCNQCQKVTVINTSNPIVRFKCRFCDRTTQLKSMRVISTTCNCGMTWTHRTNLTSPTLWIRCQKCGEKTLVKWDEKSKKYSNWRE